MERSTEVANVLGGWFRAVATGDGAWADAHLSPHIRVTGTDPAEVLEGHDAVAFLKREALGLARLATFEVAEPEAYVSGNVGWGFANPVITFKDGSGVVSPRWTGVVERDGDTWRIVQIHASVGVGNDDAGYEMPG